MRACAREARQCRAPSLVMRRIRGDTHCIVIAFYSLKDKPYSRNPVRRATVRDFRTAEAVTNCNGLFWIPEQLDILADCGIVGPFPSHMERLGIRLADRMPFFAPRLSVCQIIACLFQPF